MVAARRTRPTGAAAARAAEAHRRLADATGRPLPLRLWDGSELGPDDAPYRLELRRPPALRTLVQVPPDRAVGEAYARGELEIHGDIVTALADLVETGLADIGWRTRRDIVRVLLGLAPPGWRPLALRVRDSGRRFGWDGDLRALRDHAELPERLGESLLGPDLVSSCGYFLREDEPLPVAQTRELDLACRKLGLVPGMRVLDATEGRAALLTHAAAHYDVDGVAVAPTPAQRATAEQRLRDAGLGGRPGLRLVDSDHLAERFDAVAAIGVAEHAGPLGLLPQLRRLRGLLAPGGVVLLHRVVAGDSRRPGGAPAARRDRPTSAWRAVRDAERAGLSLIDVEQLRGHYALTLRAWVANLESHRDDVVAAAGEAAYRAWRAHVATAAVRFETGELGAVRLVAAREAAVRARRAWWLPRVSLAPRPASPA